MIPRLLPYDQSHGQKTSRNSVICVTHGLAFLAYFLETHNSLHISEIVGIFLLFLAIVPPNLAVIYPWILPAKQGPGSKSTAR